MGGAGEGVGAGDVAVGVLAAGVREVGGHLGAAVGVVLAALTSLTSTACVFRYSF